MKTKYIFLALLSTMSLSLYGQQSERSQEHSEETTSKVALGMGIEVDGIHTSISQASVDSQVLEKSSKFTVADALYGLIPGLQIMQSSGFNASPSISLRGSSSLTNNAPLILVDGIARDSKQLALAGIESVTVLKDATAAALYGVNGANGVILITTKRGKNQPMEINVNYNTNINTPFRQPNMVDAATYARCYNEAQYNDGIYTPQYSEADIALFESGASPYTHPNVNWVDEMYKSSSMEHRFDVTANGGNDRVKYFTLVNYQNAQGLLQPTNLDKASRYQSQIGKVSMNFRSNIDAQLTKSTTMKLSLLGNLSEQNQPKDYGTAISNAYRTPAAAFPVYSSNGNFASTSYYKYNPIAQAGATGASKYISRTLMIDLRLNQSLDIITEGLYAEGAIAYDVTGNIFEGTSRTYQYDVLASNNLNTLAWTPNSEDSNIDYSSSLNSISRTNNVDLKLGYDKRIGQHSLKTSIIYNQRFYDAASYNSTQKRQSIIAFADYNYDNRYVATIVANYSGSAVMPKGDRFEFYPAISAGWILSNENFMKSSSIDLLKLRVSSGISGWDGLSHGLFNEYYTLGGSYLFNPESTMGGSSYVEGKPAVEGLAYERNVVNNIGVDFVALNSRLAVTAEVFQEHRSQMLVDGSSSVSSVLGVGANLRPIGEVENRGVELSAQWNDKVGDFSYSVGGNLSFARNTIIENGEIQRPSELAHLNRIGSSIGATYGLESLGFFESWEDIQSSPSQGFGEVRPGDIKYKDQDGDGEITDDDVVKYGFSGVTPELYYGFNVNLEYKGFGIFALFQGVGNRNVYLSADNLIFPMEDGNNISEWYLAGEGNVRWTPDTASTATLPRLTTSSNDNNFRSSTTWYRDGSYLKLRNLELFYNVPAIKDSFFDGARVYLRAANLFSLDKLGDLDPENYGIGYPSVRTFSIGVNIKL